MFVRSADSSGARSCSGTPLDPLIFVMLGQSLSELRRVICDRASSVSASVERVLRFT
jgi:hypothetical protein